MGQAAIKWTPVDSSNVDAVFYNEPAKKLAVKFLNGGLYVYSDVESDMWQNLVGAESVGKYLARVIKIYCPYTKFETEDELLASIGTV